MDHPDGIKLTDTQIDTPNEQKALPQPVSDGRAHRSNPESLIGWIPLDFPRLTPKLMPEMTHWNATRTSIKRFAKES